MADVGEEEEYESDPDQVKLSLKMRRRREASDDEEEGDDPLRRGQGVDSRVSDCESDGQGAAEYDDEKYYLEEEGEELLEEIEEQQEEEFGGGCGENMARSLGPKHVASGLIEKTSLGEKRENKQIDGGGVYVEDNADQFGDNGNGREGEGEGEGEGVRGQSEEEKKENEPFAVPTAGAFYMHDDRFRDSTVGRHRRTPSMKKLWESKDNRKWGHDKFDEMTMQERHHYEYQGRRASRGRNRAPGGSRGQDRGYAQGNRSKEYDSNNQNNEPKFLRGRGPRRYQASTKNNIEDRAQSRQPVKSVEKTSHANSGRVSSARSTPDSAQVPARKNICASSLNSASVPFYPSGPSNKEINSTQKRDSQIGQISRSKAPPVMGENYSQSNMRGKNVSDSIGMDKLYIDDSISPLSGKGKAGMQSSGMSLYPLAGSQVVGSSGSKGGNHGDPNFPGANFLPVMQFAGQHPGGIRVPAVGMAFPGYVSQPNGMGNSEMTWLPVLAGAAGALGATRGLGAPYITMNSAYHARTSGQPSSLVPASSNDSNTNKPGHEVKPSQGPELVNDELGQRQNKARRYTEMKFDQ